MNAVARQLPATPSPVPPRWRWGWLALGVALGVVLCVGGAAVLHVARFAKAPLLEGAVDHAMQPLAVDPSWIKSGQPRFRALQYARDPVTQAESGLWACDGPTTFEWTFHSDEAVHILDGEVQIDYDGRRFVLKPGQSAYFQAGTQAVWHVPERLLKTYTLHHPSRLARWVRDLTDD